MEHITVHELYELYNDTLKKCGVYLLNETDEIIAYNIYEEFDIGVHSFFHIDNLSRLQKAGLISLDKLDASSLLRDKVIQLQHSNEWRIENFKTSIKWKEIMKLADEIKEMN